MGISVWRMKPVSVREGDSSAGYDWMRFCSKLSREFKEFFRFDPYMCLTFPHGDEWVRRLKEEVFPRWHDFMQRVCKLDESADWYGVSFFWVNKYYGPRCLVADIFTTGEYEHAFRIMFYESEDGYMKMDELYGLFVELRKGLKVLVNVRRFLNRKLIRELEEKFGNILVNGYGILLEEALSGGEEDE